MKEADILRAAELIKQRDAFHHWLRKLEDATQTPGCRVQLRFAVLHADGKAVKSGTKSPWIEPAALTASFSSVGDGISDQLGEACGAVQP